MKKISLLLLITITFNTLGMSKTLEQQSSKSKSKLSKTLDRIKSIKRIDQKSMLLSKFMVEFNKGMNQQLNSNHDLTEIELDEISLFKENINFAFENTNLESHQELDNFMEYLESEYNQASAVGLVILGIAVGGIAVFCMLLCWVLTL